MFPNRYWANYWADRYWPPVGEDAEPAEPSGGFTSYVVGMGIKTRNHPHPMFNRVKQ